MHDLWSTPRCSIVAADSFDHGKVFALIVAKTVVVMNNSIARVKKSRAGNVMVGRDKEAGGRIPLSCSVA